MPDTASGRHQHFPVDIVRRVLITLAALFVYRLASAVPILGVSVHSSHGFGFGAMERLSFMALGILPWISATLLAEIVNLLSPAWLRLPSVRNGHADPFSLWVVALAMLFAAVQAYGVAVALEAMPQIVAAPGMAFRAGTIASLVGGTALAILLGGVISRDGIGFGFWVLWAAVGLLIIKSDVLRLVAALHQGIVSPAIALVNAAVTIAAIAAVVGLVLTRHKRGLKAAEPLVWPIFIYAAVSPWFAVAVQIVAGSLSEAPLAYEIVLPHRPAGAVLAIAILLAVAGRYGRRRGGLALVIPEAAVLSAILFASTVAPQFVAFIIPGGGYLVVMAAVATVILTSHQIRTQP